MIDFHSHILPKMDDGSASLEESCELLLKLAQQGVDTVVATPHFYANDESVSQFLSRRDAAFKSLAPKITSDMPKILLGAEVKYYKGISRMENLTDLCVEGSNLLLLEMPFCKWSEYTVKELINIALFSDVTLVLAHIERYMGFQSKKVWNSLLENDVLMQVNAEFINNFFARNKAFKMLKNQAVHLIGSDCHNLTDRSPRIGEAFCRIAKKFGGDFVDYINGYQKNILFGNR